MLILSRKPNEKLVLPSVNVAVQVVKILGNSVRLGIEAPQDVPVYREELLKSCDAPPAGAHRHAEQATQSPATDSKSSPMAREELERLLDCVVFAFDFAHSALDRGEIQEARRVLAKAIQHLERIRSQCFGPRPTPDSRSPRLLLVERDSQRRKSMAETLRSAGYEVEAVEDGCRALDLLSRQGRPDILLLDFSPARSRCEDAAATVRAIRSNPAWSHLKVIGLGRKGEAEINVSIGARGVDRWIETPTSPESLLSGVESKTESVRS